MRAVQSGERKKRAKWASYWNLIEAKIDGSYKNIMTIVIVVINIIIIAIVIYLLIGNSIL